MNTPVRVFLSLMTALLLCSAWPLVAADEKPFSPEQLDQLVGPIALYPDPLVAQILMASTYPLEIVQAARWVDQNRGLSDEILEKQLETQPWEASVKSLVHVPDVLKRMNDNLDWTQDLGDAVLAQQQDVMAAVQRMRRLAHEAGNLESSKEQVVVVKQETIVIEPATKVVYVPAYNPTVVYGTAWVPASYYYPIYTAPASYWYPPGYATTAAVSFGVGMAVGAAVWGNWGNCNWGRGDIDINVNRNINTGDINIGNRVGGGDRTRVSGGQKWQHKSEHRGGVRYKDGATRQNFSRTGTERGAGRVNRDTARGYSREGSRTADRTAARSSTSDRSGSSSRRTGDSSRRSSSSRSSTSGSGRSSAFSVGNSGFDRSASRRGASSRGYSGGGGSRSFSGGGRSFSGGGRGGGRRR